MEVEFEPLITLQETDTKITQLSNSLKSIPFRIQKIENQRKEIREAVIKAKEKLSGNQKKRRELEKEVQSLKDKISKYKLQLNEVKTNKEYTALLKEIDDAQQEVDRLEEQIIEEMLNADEIKVEIKKADQRSQEQDKKLAEEESAIHQQEQDLKNQIELLSREKADLIPKIPSKCLDLYHKIYSKKNGIVLSPVNDEFCSICNMRIRPQVLNELKVTRKLIFCENCGRILYWAGKVHSIKAK
ncbi:MAG: zinc ribbon domain-containing protein [Candidatus Aminicenantia bacterium]